MALLKNDLLIKQLIEFGLSEKESRVYLTLLKLDTAVVGEVAKIAGTNRSTTYVVLEMLKKKGFVNAPETKKVQSYTAISPELLLYEAENKSKKAEEIKNKINSIMPQLKALHSNSSPELKIIKILKEKGLMNILEDA